MNSREYLQKITQVFTLKRVKIFGFALAGFFALFSGLWLLGRKSIVDWGLEKVKFKLLKSHNLKEKINTLKEIAKENKYIKYNDKNSAQAIQILKEK